MNEREKRERRKRYKGELAALSLRQFENFSFNPLPINAACIWVNRSRPPFPFHVIFPCFVFNTPRYGIAFLPYYDSSWIVTLKWCLLLVWGNYSHYEKVKTLGSCPFCILSLWCIFICPGVNMKWSAEMHTQTYHQSNDCAVGNDWPGSQGCLHLVTALSFCPHCIFTCSIADDLSRLKFSSVSSCIKMTSVRQIISYWWKIKDRDWWVRSVTATNPGSLPTLPKGFISV